MNNPKDNHATHNVAMLAFEGAEILDVVGPLDVFSAVNQAFRADGMPMPYKVAILAEKAGPITTSSGLKIVADGAWWDWTEPIDTLMVAGGPDISAIASNTSMIQWIRTKADSVYRLASICTGAFALAEAGFSMGAAQRPTGLLHDNCPSTILR